MYCVETVNTLLNFNFPKTKAEFVALEQNEDRRFECMVMYGKYKKTLAHLKATSTSNVAELNNALELVERVSANGAKYALFMNTPRSELGYPDDATVKTKATLRDLGIMTGAMLLELQKLEGHETPEATLEAHRASIESIMLKQTPGKSPNWNTANNELSAVAKYWLVDAPTPPPMTQDFIFSYIIAIVQLLAQSRPKTYGKGSTTQNGYNFSQLQSLVVERLKEAVHVEDEIKNAKNLRNDLSSIMKSAK